MSALLLVIAITAASMVLLVAYAEHLFKENRTRIERPRAELSGRRDRHRPADDFEPDVIWRTLVGPEVRPSPVPLHVPDDWDEDAVSRRAA